MKCLIAILCLFCVTQIGFAQMDEPRLVSPIAALARSAVLPGWGQFYIHSYRRGGIVVAGTGASLVGALLANQAFQDVYNNQYVKAARVNPNSEEAIFQFNRANQRFKLRQFFLYAAVGVWVYSIIDSYVGANFYNATAKADLLMDDAKQIEKLGVKVGIAPTQFHLSLTKAF